MFAKRKGGKEKTYIDEKNLARRPIQDAVLKQGELLLRVLLELGDAGEAEFLGHGAVEPVKRSARIASKPEPRINVRKRILMQICLLGPCLIEAIMTAHSVRHAPRQLGRMRVRDPRSVIPARAQSPACDSSHVEDALRRHPGEDAVPQPLRAVSICRIGGAIGRPRNLHNHARPSSFKEFVRPLRVIGPVPVQSRQEQHRWDFVFDTRFAWNPRVDWDLFSLFGT